MPEIELVRRQRLQPAIQALGADAALITRLPNVRYLTGLASSNAALLLPATGAGGATGATGATGAGGATGVDGPAGIEGASFAAGHTTGLDGRDAPPRPHVARQRRLQSGAHLG